ncbi:LysR family transcriptional regulator [Methylocapsa aurea]|uniref:LysR family transcriptional regulator n=1 Tax=Methylocapsa aurea TaxID=663610 RepID=UPI00068E7777|nr:LysR family transcriptional regulator [Methylocapsa aurea]
MELHQIRHFVAVVETGSFTKGAQRAAVSQPAISASIARLEAELDVKLLDRRSSPIVPTAAGMRLLEAGKNILCACNSVRAEIKTIAAPQHLKLGILQSISSWRVSRLLSSFRRANSGVAIEVFDGTCEQLLEFLDDQQLDAILTIFDDEALKYASRALFKEPYVLAVPKEHRFAHRQSVKLAELDDEPFIVRTRCDRYQEVTNLLIARGVKLRVVYQTDQDDRALALVASGIGISLFPAHFDVPAVKQVPVSDLALVRTIGLLWSPEREDGDLKEFITFAESHAWTP